MKRINFKSKDDFDWGEYWADQAIPLCEAAEALNYSASQIIRQIRLGRIKGYKSKGKWFVVLPKNQRN
ncbi:MAG: hypothetical protein RLZZ04_90 [Cyanobacteriota bacterium]|jgi:hypothetical protein